MIFHEIEARVVTLSLFFFLVLPHCWHACASPHSWLVNPLHYFCSHFLALRFRSVHSLDLMTKGVVKQFRESLNDMYRERKATKPQIK